MSRARAWCFTHNNAGLLDAPFDYSEESMLFLIYQKEAAPTTGLIHFQGYVVFTNPKGLPGVKKLDPTAHWEIAKGNHAQNIAYCSKEPRVGDTVERGSRPAPG